MTNQITTTTVTTDPLLDLVPHRICIKHNNFYIDGVVIQYLSGRRTGFVRMYDHDIYDDKKLLSFPQGFGELPQTHWYTIPPGDFIIRIRATWQANPDSHYPQSYCPYNTISILFNSGRVLRSAPSLLSPTIPVWWTDDDHPLPPTKYECFAITHYSKLDFYLRTPGQCNHNNNVNYSLARWASEESFDFYCGDHNMIIHLYSLKNISGYTTIRTTYNSCFDPLYKTLPLLDPSRHLLGRQIIHSLSQSLRVPDRAVQLIFSYLTGRDLPYSGQLSNPRIPVQPNFAVWFKKFYLQECIHRLKEQDLCLGDMLYNESGADAVLLQNQLLEFGGEYRWSMINEQILLRQEWGEPLRMIQEWRQLQQWREFQKVWFQKLKEIKAYDDHERQVFQLRHEQEERQQRHEYLQNLFIIRISCGPLLQELPESEIIFKTICSFLCGFDTCTAPARS